MALVMCRLLGSRMTSTIVAESGGEGGNHWQERTKKRAALYLTNNYAEGYPMRHYVKERPALCLNGKAGLINIQPVVVQSTVMR